MNSFLTKLLDGMSFGINTFLNGSQSTLLLFVAAFFKAKVALNHDLCATCMQTPISDVVFGGYIKGFFKHAPS